MLNPCWKQGTFFLFYLSNSSQGIIYLLKNGSLGLTEMWLLLIQPIVLVTRRGKFQKIQKHCIDVFKITLLCFLSK